MINYEQYSREELIQRIEELEQKVTGLTKQVPLDSCTNRINTLFKSAHGAEILDILPDMLSIFDRDYNYVALVSSEQTVHVGGNSKNLIGKNLRDILPSDAYIPVKENFDKVLSTGKASIGFHNLYVEGQLENFENRVIPLDDKHILCICRNITDRISTQSRLQMVTSAVNNSLEEIYAVHTNGSLVFANKQFINHHCLQGDPTEYKIYDIFPHTDDKYWKNYLNQLRSNGENHSHTIRLKNLHDQERLLEISAFILKSNNGEEIIWTIARDISERIEREHKIYELNQLMETILNNIPVYLFVKDTGNGFRYLYWNKELEKSSSIPASVVVGKTDEEIFPDQKDAEKFRQDDLQLLKDQKMIEFEEDYLTASGERRKVRTIKTLTPLEGKKPLLIGISWDITQQKATEVELIKARNKAEESDKLKSAFLANMSHEIRTPLNAIVGFSKLLGETDDPIEKEQFCDIIDKNTDLLLQLINDILDLSKIEAGMLEFNTKNISINQLCQGIYNTFFLRMPSNVQLVYDPIPEEINLFTDGNRLAQVLSNLLNNARKFTEKGEIRFGFRPRGEWIEFYVRDTGLGISKENIDKIFTRFVKLNSFIQGTGLGLSICKMIIEKLGGNIRVTSQENKGTEFRFTRPAYRVNTDIEEGKNALSTSAK